MKINKLFIHTQYEMNIVINMLPSHKDNTCIIKPFHQISIKRKFVPLNQRKNIIVFLGRFTKERGIENFIKFINFDISKKFEYIIASNTININKLIPNNKIKVIHQYLEYNEYIEIISKSLFVIIPFTKEIEGRLSGIFCDAISCGTPIIASNIEPYVEFFIKYGPMGYLINFNNKEDIVNFFNDNYLGKWDVFQKSLEKARKSHNPEIIKEIVCKEII
jgi:glycosyltransferase involved in cell wall biosynthesis